jgi:hypothetical protein
MVFNTTFNNISVISWQSDLLEKETRILVPTHTENYIKSLRVAQSNLY